METFQTASPSVNLSPVLIQERLNLAIGHHSAGRFKEAEKLYLEILEADAEQPAALHLLGVIALQAGAHERAVELIGKAIAIKPDFTEAYNNLGTTLRALGRLEEAVSVYQKALALKPDFSDAHYNLGTAFVDSGQLSEAADSYQKALDYNPDFVMAHFNLGKVLLRLDRVDDAITAFQKTIAIDPMQTGAYSSLGLSLQMIGRQEEAVGVYAKLLEIQPDNTDACFNLGKLYHELGRVKESVENYQRGLNLYPDHAEVRSNLGLALQDLGQMDEAMECYRQAAILKPELLEAHYNLGNLLQGQKKADEAIVSYRKALEINPGFVKALNNIGVLYKDAEKLDDAIVVFKQAIAADPGYSDAYDNLCEILEKTNDTEALRTVVDEAKRHCLQDVRLAHREAQLLKRDGDFAAARAVLEPYPDIKDDLRFNAAKGQLLGDLCDRLDDADAAFKYFQHCNSLRRMTLDPQVTSAQIYLDEIDGLAQAYTPEWVANWQETDIEDVGPDPVFLVGFPRSGTTLLDTILRSHHEISVLEEGPAVKLMEKAAAKLLGSYPGGLVQVDREKLTKIRQVFFEAWDKQNGIDKTSKIVIDKMPLNLIGAGLIHRIFPKARFLFSLRHPCDCVLSCFMQDFELNNAMSNFLDIQDAAHLYDRVMALWSQYQQVLPLRVQTVRYENLIESFDETLNPVLAFLDLKWDEGMRDYAETARNRGLIRTPSYNQVTQPLYTRARGRWRRYQTQMAPVLPVLQPWINAYGYDS